ncbi:LuxR C-terminal-related transcriptional regulator [Lentzea sp. NPDC051208]|uniref:helix-turn-helix transcriptional regulator n=1 Tax=Lentzea sp. NPDC051208 TaxID=3154642 RepID=UPI003430D6A8
MSQPRHTPLSDALVGRADERDLIGRLSSTTLEGHPSVLVLQGDPGIGKSALLRACLTDLQRFRVVTVSGEPAYAHDPWSMLDQLEAKLGLPSTTARTTFARGMHFVDSMGVIEQSSAVAIAIDDLHWCDTESLDALALALRRLSDGDQVLVVATCRPPVDGLPESWRRMMSQTTKCRVVELGGLSVEHVAALARAAGLRLLPRDVEALHKHTAGNPLHVRALLDEASERSLKSGVHSLAPREYAQLTTDRLAGLPADGRAVVQALSVLRRRASLPELAHVADVEHVHEAVPAAAAAGLVQWDRSTVSERVTLAHPLVGAAVTSAMPVPVRRAMNARAAEVSSGRSQMEHRVAAAPARDAALAAELTERAEAAHRAREHDLAALYLHWSSDLVDDQVLRERCLLDSCYERLLDGNHQPVVDMLGDINDLPDKPRRSLVLGTLATQLGRPEEGAERLRSALSRTDPEQDPTLHARLVCELGWALYYSGSSGEVIFEAIAPLAGAEVDDPYVQDSLAGLTTIARGTLLGVLTAIEEFGRLGVPDSPRDAPPELAEVLLLRGCMRWGGLGEHDTGVDDLTEAIDRFRLGVPSRLIGSGYAHLAGSTWFLGDWTRAEHYAALAQDTAGVGELSSANSYASLVPSCRGESARARAYLDAAFEALDPAPHPDWSVSWSIGMIVHCHATEDTALLRQHIDGRIMSVGLHRISGGGWRAWLVLVFIHGYLLAGQVSRATALIEDLALDPHTAPWVGMLEGWLRGSVAWANGDLRRAEENYEAALRVAVDHASEAPLYHAHLLADHGRLLVATNHRRSGIEQLRKAHGIYEKLGARPFWAQTRQALVDTGLRVGEQTSRSSPLSLTTRERDIASFVARGLTNREIAQQLFVTQKTVEYHLANVFAKCGINSRRKLREMADALLAG